MAYNITHNGEEWSFEDNVPKEKAAAFIRKQLNLTAPETPASSVPTPTTPSAAIPQDWFPGAKLEQEANVLGDMFTQKYISPEKAKEFTDRNLPLPRPLVPESAKANVPPQFIEGAIPTPATTQELVDKLKERWTPDPTDSSFLPYRTAGKYANNLLGVLQTPGALLQTGSQMLPWASLESQASVDPSFAGKVVTRDTDASDANLLNNLTGSPFNPNPSLTDELLSSLVMGAGVGGARKVFKTTARALQDLTPAARQAKLLGMSQGLDALLPSVKPDPLQGLFNAVPDVDVTVPRTTSYTTGANVQAGLPGVPDQFSNTVKLYDRVAGKKPRNVTVKPPLRTLEDDLIDAMFKKDPKKSDYDLMVDEVPDTGLSKTVVKLPGKGVRSGITKDPRYQLLQDLQFPNKLTMDPVALQAAKKQRYLESMAKKLDEAVPASFGGKSNTPVNTVGTLGTDYLKANGYGDVYQRILTDANVPSPVIATKYLIDNHPDMLPPTLKQKWTTWWGMRDPLRAEAKKLQSVDPTIAKDLPAMETAALNEFQETAGSFLKEFNTIAKPYLTTDSTKLAEFDRIAEALDAGDIKKVPVSQEALSAYNGIKNLYQKLGEMATQAGVQVRDINGELRDFVALKNYFTRKIDNYEVIKLQQIIKQSYDLEGNLNIEAAVQKALSSGITKDAASVRAAITNFAKKATPVKNSFQKARTTTGSIADLRKEGLSIDTSPQVVADYIAGMSKSIADARIYGSKYENLEKLRLYAQQKFGHLGSNGNLSKQEELVNSYIDDLTGVNKYTTHPLVQAVRNTNNFLFGPATPLLQVAQAGMTTVDAGIPAFFKTLRNQLQRGTKILDSAEADELGVTIPQTLDAIAQAQGIESQFDDILSRASNAYTSMLQIKNLDKYARITAAEVGKDFIPKVTKAFLDNPGNKYHRLLLEDYAPHLDLDTIIQRGKFTTREERDIIRGFVGEINFNMKVGDLPRWFKSDAGKLLTQFIPSAYMHTVFLKKMLLRSVKSGNISPLINWAIASSMLGEVHADVKNIFSGDIESIIEPESERNQFYGLSGILGRSAQNTLAHGPGLGWASNVIEGPQYGKYLGALLGPGLGERVESIDDFITELTDVDKPRRGQRNSLQQLLNKGNKALGIGVLRGPLNYLANDGVTKKKRK